MQFRTKRAGLIAILLIGLSCNREHTKTISSATEKPVHPRDIHQIDLPKYAAISLPAAPGREEFATNCMTCHSPRYIAIQPPLTAAKWEESVRKMMKTYGAPIAEDQVQPIVQYLMATKESNAGNELMPIRMPSPDPSTLTPVPDSGNVSAADLDRAAKLYVARCAPCHGFKGAGDGIGASAMLPHPSNLLAARYSFTSVARAMCLGVPGTAMPPTPNLSSDDVRALSVYVQQLSQVKSDPSKEANTPEIRQLYAQTCATCHGPNGEGDGPAGAALARTPANFRTIQPGKEAAIKSISEGIPGSGMPAWKSKLTDVQRQALADYVRTMYVGD
jgi:mono/diheme cytochrome c family protein